MQPPWEAARKYRICPVLCLSFILAVASLRAAEYRGHVIFNGFGIPGVVVAASKGDQKVVTITNPEGEYVFPDLADGAWNIVVEMQAFTPLEREVTVRPGMASGVWELQLLSIDRIQGTQVPAPSNSLPSDPASFPSASPKAQSKTQIREKAHKLFRQMRKLPFSAPNLARQGPRDRRRPVWKEFRPHLLRAKVSTG